jgi:hypothetical protein
MFIIKELGGSGEDPISVSVYSATVFGAMKDGRGYLLQSRVLPRVILPADVHPTFLSILLTPSVLSIIGFLTFPLARADARSKSCATAAAAATIGLKSVRLTLSCVTRHVQSLLEPDPVRITGLLQDLDPFPLKRKVVVAFQQG